MNRKTVAIYPGRFQMPHKGHLSVYSHLSNKFTECFVAMSDLHADSNSESPFTFEQRRKLLNALGVPLNRIVKVHNPYIASEIITRHCGRDDVVVFGIGEKDKDRISFGNKKDGSAKYLQPWTPGVLESNRKHGYVYVVPTQTYIVEQNTFTSASEARSLYKSLKYRQRVAFSNAMYGEDLTEVLNEGLGIRKKK